MEKRAKYKIFKMNFIYIVLKNRYSLGIFIHGLHMKKTRVSLRVEIIEAELIVL